MALIVLPMSLTMPHADGKVTVDDMTDERQSAATVVCPATPEQENVFSVSTN
jgi:hypothetical protein